MFQKQCKKEKVPAEFSVPGPHFFPHIESLPAGLSLNRSFFQICYVISGSTFFPQLVKASQNGSLYPCNLFVIFFLDSNTHDPLKNISSHPRVHGRHQTCHFGYHHLNDFTLIFSNFSKFPKSFNYKELN